MRRTMGHILVGLGVALLTLGLALSTWAYPKIARVTTEYPTAKDLKVAGDPPAGTSVSNGAVSVFIAREGQPVGPQSLDVIATRVTKGVPEAASGNNAYYESSVSLDAPALNDKAGIGNDGQSHINISIDGVCFDRNSGKATTSCKKPNYTASGKGDVTEPAFAGQVFKFPFNTGKRNYPFWDGTAGKSFDIDFKGEDKISGLRVYRFEQTIDEMKVGSKDGLPASLFGGAAGASVAADIMYSNTRTVWVEPETGAVIKGVEKQKRVFRANGADVDYLVGEIGYSDATVAANVKAQKSNASALHFVRSTALPLGVFSGLALAGLGLFLLFGRRRSAAGNEYVDLTEAQARRAARTDV